MLVSLAICAHLIAFKFQERFKGLLVLRSSVRLGISHAPGHDCRKTCDDGSADGLVESRAENLDTEIDEDSREQEEKRRIYTILF